MSLLGIIFINNPYNPPIMPIKQINFQSPDIEELNKEGFLCVDMHCHTDYSDGAPLKNMLSAAKKKNIGMAITDHNEIGGAVEAMKQNEVFIIPGIEVNCHDGPHILCYFYELAELERFYKNEIEKYRTEIRRAGLFKFKIVTRKTVDIVEAAKKYRCIVSLAHPYALIHMNFERALLKNHDLRDVMNQVDAVEIVTSSQTKKANRRACALKILFDKGMTAGSDAHTAYDLGGAVSCAKAKDVEDFLDSVKLKVNSVVGKESLKKKVAYTTRLAKRGGGLLKKSLINRVTNPFK